MTDGDGEAAFLSAEIAALNIANANLKRKIQSMRSSLLLIKAKAHRIKCECDNTLADSRECDSCRIYTLSLDALKVSKL